MLFPSLEPDRLIVISSSQRHRSKHDPLKGKVMAISLASSAITYSTAPNSPPLLTPNATPRVLLDEWHTLATLPLLIARTPQLARIPRGNGSLVIDIPGWMAPEASMAPLRTFLRLKGHNAQGWGLGINRGRPEADTIRLTEKVVAAAKKTGHPVSLVGWSLGGLIAREVARAVPNAVKKVLTFGTPIIGGPTYTIGARSFGDKECQRISALLEELDQTSPITTPLTIIFTRRDRVVSWGACIDRRSPNVEHIEVKSTHIGLGLDPDVWSLIATRLASVL
jgi:hypothetical protein